MSTTEEEAERRIEIRKTISHPVHVDAISPAWALSGKGWNGQTVNITPNGLQLYLTDFDQVTGNRWIAYSKSSDSIQVRIQIKSEVATTEVEGEVVWIDWEQGGGQKTSFCNFGIYLSLLTAAQEKAIKAILAAS